MPLSADLIDLASLSYLILDLAGLGIPELLGLLVSVKKRFISKIDLLEIVFAVEQIFFDILLAVVVKPAVFVRLFVFSEVIGHYRSGFESGDIISFKPA